MLANESAVYQPMIWNKVSKDIHQIARVQIQQRMLANPIAVFQPAVWTAATEGTHPIAQLRAQDRMLNLNDPFLRVILNSKLRQVGPPKTNIVAYCKGCWEVTLLGSDTLSVDEYKADINELGKLKAESRSMFNRFFRW